MDISHQETNSYHETSFNKNWRLAKLLKFVSINDTVGFVKDTDRRGPVWAVNTKRKWGCRKCKDAIALEPKNILASIIQK